MKTALGDSTAAWGTSECERPTPPPGGADGGPRSDPLQLVDHLDKKQRDGVRSAPHRGRNRQQCPRTGPQSTPTPDGATCTDGRCVPSLAAQAAYRIQQPRLDGVRRLPVCARRTRHPLRDRRCDRIGRVKATIAAGVAAAAAIMAATQASAQDFEAERRQVCADLRAGVEPGQIRQQLLDKYGLEGAAQLWDHSRHMYCPEFLETT